MFFSDRSSSATIPLWIIDDLSWDLGLLDVYSL